MPEDIWARSLIYLGIRRDKAMKNTKVSKRKLRLLREKREKAEGLKGGLNLKITVGKDGLSRLEDESGTVFLSKTSDKAIDRDYFLRYVYCHYALCKTPPAKYTTCNQHRDNLNNLPCGKEAQALLKTIMPVKKGDTVVEAGAFQGFGTIYLSQTVGKEGLVVAIEGDANNCEMLCRNLEVNNIKNVIPIHAAVWDCDKMLPFYSTGSQRRSLVESLLKYNSSEAVQARTIDGILDDLGIENIDFLSLEVNSAEAAALRGLKKRLSSKHPMRVVSAGWYKDNDGVLGADAVSSELKKHSFVTHLGVRKRVYGYRR